MQLHDLLWLVGIVQLNKIVTLHHYIINVWLSSKILFQANNLGNKKTVDSFECQTAVR